MLPAAPDTRDALLERATSMAGRDLAWVAERVGQQVPADQRRAKGFIGRLLELALGATGGSAAVHDFPDLRVELKSIPVDMQGKPKESTYVCTAPLDGSIDAEWEASWVCQKLSCVLWVPVAGGAEMPLARRLVGMPLLWQPDAEESAQLREDWEALTELIITGRVADLTAHRGQALQVRPKAASSRSMTWTVNEWGESVQHNPRGFYLRPSFTAGVLARHYRLPA